MLSNVYDLIVFDLDGTLVDSLEDLRASLNHALARRELPALGLDQVRQYVGEGARRLVERSVGPGASPETVQAVLDLFLEHYREHCLDRSRLYPGMREALEELARGGARLAVLTNKPEALARRVLGGLGVAGRFRDIAGGDRGPRKPDPAVLLSIAAAAGVPPDRAVLVGDTAVDLETARRAGMAAAGVLWGFRPAEVEAGRPEHLSASPADLVATGREA